MNRPVAARPTVEIEPDHRDGLLELNRLLVLAFDEFLDGRDIPDATVRPPGAVETTQADTINADLLAFLKA
jgi:hypothetical protein